MCLCAQREEGTVCVSGSGEVDCCCSCCCHGVGASYPHGRSGVPSGRGEAKRPLCGFAPTPASATCSAGAELIASDNRLPVSTVSLSKKVELSWRRFEESHLRGSPGRGNVLFACPLML